MWIYIVLAIVVMVFIYFGVTYNSLIKLKNRVKEAFSTMDVYLKKRWDLIPNLVEVVKGYATHEKETLIQIVACRNGDYNDLSEVDKIKTNEEINNDVSKLIALAEAYPDLKANENFLALSDELSSIEDEIAQSRKYYNGTVRIFNNKVQMFPSNIVAKLLGFKEQKMFESKESERENVQVKV